MPGRPQRPEQWRRVFSAALTFASLSTSGCGLQQNVRLLYDMWFIFVKAFLSPILVRYLRLLSRVFRPEGPQDFVTSFIIKNQESRTNYQENPKQIPNPKYKIRISAISFQFSVMSVSCELRLGSSELFCIPLCMRSAKQINNEDFNKIY